MHANTANSTRFLTVFLLSGIAACGDAARTPTAPLANRPPLYERRGEGDREEDGGRARFVALGTSISMGVASAGVLAASQQQDWTAQFARLEEFPFSQPLIQAPGCGSPLAAPLALGVRLDGEPTSGSTVCAPNVTGVTLPTNDVAIDGASVHEALAVTPEIAAGVDAHRGALFSRVLAPGQTQVTAMLAQRPHLVSVELGAADLTGARGGLLIPDVTYTSYASWQRDYDQVIEAVASIRTHGVLVGLLHHLASFPSLRRGAELYADRAEFNNFYIDVSTNCQNSPNLLFVFNPILNAAAQAQYNVHHGLPMPTISCADVPGTFDFVLTPADEAVLDTQIAQMNAHTAALARKHHYAYFELEALYGLPEVRPPFSVTAFLLGQTPFGPLISLDGIHPSAAGHAILAAAAARALADHDADARTIASSQRDD